MRIGFRTSPQNTDWASLEAAWAEAGRHDVFDSGWLNDHLSDPGREQGGPSFESMTALAALARLVPGKAVGQTVLAATFRHPAMLAKEAVTLDHLTGGHYILALGAGWHAWEHEAFGIELPPIGVRFDRFESTIRVLRVLFGDANPIGKVVRLKQVPHMVIGILSPKGTSNTGRDQDDIVVVPLKTARSRLLGANAVNPDRIDTILVKVEDTWNLKQAENDIRALIRERPRLAARLDEDINVKNMAEVLKIKESSAGALALLVAAIASVSLIVGGIGIMNIMLVSVVERTREIGIRMAVGARRRDILSQFLVEAVTLSVIGGLIGIGLGVLSSLTIATFAEWPFIFSLQAVLLAVGFSITVGVVFGFYPARRASLLDPIEALRHE